MKNIFFVINKEKIYAYVVSVCTIITLFFISGITNSNFEEIKETSSNIDVTINNCIKNEYNSNDYNIYKIEQ